MSAEGFEFQDLLGFRVFFRNLKFTLCFGTFKLAVDPHLVHCAALVSGRGACKRTAC